MKKIKKTFIIFALFICIMVILIIPSKEVQAAGIINPNLISMQQTNKDGLGYAMNIVKDKYLDISEIKTGSPILKEDFHAEMLDKAIKTSENSSKTYSSSASCIEEIIANMQVDLGFFSSQNATLGILSANMKTGFSTSSTMDYAKHQSQYFYNLKSEFIEYTYSLPNYSSNLTAYLKNLHPDFEQAIDDVFNNSLDIFDFFDMYGTHMIAKGKYGGSLDFYYSLTSNTLDVGGTLKAKIDNELSAKVGNAISTKRDISFNLETAVGKYASRCNSQFRIMSYGGNAFSATSIDSFNNNYDLWYPSIASKPTLIGTSNDGLIPIWSFLPERYNTTANKNMFYQKFLDYVKENNISNNYLPINIGDTYKYTFERTSEKRITDSGRFKHNQRDIINLDTDLEYGIAVLAQLGFKTVTITYTAQMKEINEGYQYLFVYKSEKNNDNHLLYTRKFELIRDKLQKNYTLETFVFKDVVINEFLDTHLLVFRYGASGVGSDDWMNKNVKVTLEFNK